jgi:ankyrin repeat protein
MGRFTWVTTGPDAAERIFREVLSKHSRFSGAQVLLAGLLFERGDVPAARAIIDDLAVSSPTDVWVYLNQLRFQAKEPDPPASLRDTLMAIAKEQGFDGNVREEATSLGRHLRQTPQEYEQFLRADVEFESWTPLPCKRASLAAWLLGEGGRSREVISLLESPDGEIQDCRGLTSNRVTLARAYLLEAAKIGPGPTPANEKLVDRARALLDGNFAALVSAVVGRADYATLKPFFVEEAHFDQPDEDGNTPLCKAVYSRNTEALKEQLEIGANPMQLCADWQPVRLIMNWIGPQYAAERYEMVRLLLEAGAQPGDLSDCRSDPSSDCRILLLPLLEKYSKQK